LEPETIKEGGKGGWGKEGRVRGKGGKRARRENKEKPDPLPKRPTNRRIEYEAQRIISQKINLLSA